MDQPIQDHSMHTDLDEFHLMPWHFSPENTEVGKDCMLIATMLGDEIQTISLHVGMLPDEWTNGL